MCNGVCSTSFVKSLPVAMFVYILYVCGFPCVSPEFRGEHHTGMNKLSQGASPSPGPSQLMDNIPP